MRITKEPEERKQEILDTAMRLFYEKGYEKTSIADIAKEIGVAQGLCYRYFPSKEALFDCAIEQYADEIVSKFTISKGNEKLTLKEIIETAKEVTGIDIPVQYGDRRAGDPGTLIASSEKIKNLLGWDPKFSNVADVIKDAWKWHTSHPDGFNSK